MSRLKGGSAAIGCPAIRMSPDVGGSKPAIMRSVVVLPEPEAPRQCEEFPRGDLERQIVHRREVAEPLRQAPELENRQPDGLVGAG